MGPDWTFQKSGQDRRQISCHFVKHPSRCFERQTVRAFRKNEQRDRHGDDAAKRHLQQTGQSRLDRSFTKLVRDQKDKDGGERSHAKVWIERRRTGREKHHVSLQATPIDVGPVLREALWSQLETAVLTSATLAVGGSFDYIRSRLGVEYARDVILPSHFDYQNQALFYVPPDLPDPRTPQFAPKAAEIIRKLLEITRGRAFVLFTSYAQMRDIYQRLLGEVEFPMLLQGDAPKSALLEEFRATPNCVLFATSSFWQGVDVQGEQLSCVIIDRLPFAVPSDPVVAARVKAVDEGGGNAFFEYQVPSAVITLKQGFGRLIRSLHDRGLLALLDNRILKKQYGRVFVDSLPNYRRTTDLRQVEQWFGQN